MLSEPKNPFRAIAVTSMILSSLSGSTLIGIFFGRWLDEKWSTTPLFLIVGLLLGLATGVYGTIRIVSKYTGEE